MADGGGWAESDYQYEGPKEIMEWVMPATEFNEQTGAFLLYYGNDEQGMNRVYRIRERMSESDHTYLGGGRQVGVFKIIKKKWTSLQSYPAT